MRVSAETIPGFFFIGLQLQHEHHAVHRLFHPIEPPVPVCNHPEWTDAHWTGGLTAKFGIAGTEVPLSQMSSPLRQAMLLWKHGYDQLFLASTRLHFRSIRGADPHGLKEPSIL